MRFNPKADISGGRVRNAGGGRGGGGGASRIPLPGGARAGGGIGGVIIIILFIVLQQCTGGGGAGTGTGIDPQAQGNPQGLEEDSERYTNCKTGADANDDVDCARKAVALSLENFWATTLPDQGGTEGLAARLNAARDRLLKR